MRLMLLLIVAWGVASLILAVTWAAGAQAGYRRARGDAGWVGRDPDPPVVVRLHDARSTVR